MELPTRLDSRQGLQCGQQHRSFLLVCGAGVHDVCAITVFKSPWPIYPSLPMLSSSHARSSGRMGCSSYSSVWKRSSPSSNGSVDSGKAQLVDQLWEEYFADPTQWWDNRVDKRNPKSPDFKHKMARKALWVGGWSTPAWVKARLKPLTEGKLQCDVGYHTSDFKDTTQEIRLSKGGKGKKYSLSTSARELRQIDQGGRGGMHMQSARTMSDVIDVLKNRLEQGIAIDSYMYVEVLKWCLKQKDLVAAKQVHDFIFKSGMEQNIYVANNLLSVYIKCGRLQDARQVFDRLVKKSVYSWTIMIGGYAQHNRAKDAMEVFHEMCEEGPQPDEITCLSILKACANPSALKWGKEVHVYVRHSGLESDLRVGNALVHMYAKSGSIDDAQQVFDRMEERDLITWNVMIGGLAQNGCGREAYDLFLQMQTEGCVPNATTYLSILNTRASTGALEWVKQVHRHVLEVGLESDLRVGSALGHMYAKSGSIDDARLVFDRIEERDVITWNVIIGAYAGCGCGDEAYKLFLQMIRQGFKPDAFTYTSILNPSASVGALDWVREVHSHVLEAGFESDLCVCSALVHMYAKIGSIDDAQVVFDRMEQRDRITWNILIGGVAQQGGGREAYELFLQMKREGFRPDAGTYVSILNASESAGALEWVKEVHNDILEAGLESNLRVSSALVHMYAKSGKIGDARQVFERVKERDVTSWTTMVGGLAQHGLGHEALEVFMKMTAAGVKPNWYSFVAVLSACSHAGLVDEGRGLFLAMTQDYAIKPNVVHCNCMVDLLGRAGHLKEAKLFIGNMLLEPDGATWGALLGACRTYGDVELGKLAAKELLKLEPENASAYVLLSNIYAAAGKWEEVSLVRTMMEERGVRKEPGRSWIEVDNKIHGFVVGDTSHPKSKEIYGELSRLIERIKVEGYIPDTRLVLHNIDEEDKKLALCRHSEKLAIAYGSLNTSPGSPIRVYKNLRVCSDCHTATKFFSKVTRQEIVVRDANRFHHFKDGVCSCGDYW